MRRELRAAITRHVPDVVLVLYPGQLLVHDVRAVFQGPVVLDLFLSAHDTAVVDRRMFRPGSWPARGLARLDRAAANAASVSLLDTEPHADRLAVLTRLPRARFATVRVSDPDAPDTPAPYGAQRVGEKLEVLFFGTGVPLHGLSTVLDAVERAPGVRLVVVGGSETDRQRASQMRPGSVVLEDPFVPRERIARLLDRAHLALGIFGTSPKAELVVPFKVVHALAAARPVLTGDTLAVREALVPGVECFTCKSGDARQLAAVLSELQNQPARLAAVGAAGRDAYERLFSLRATGQQLVQILEEQTGVRALPVSPARGKELVPVSG